VHRGYIARRLSHKRADWIPGVAAKALIRNNQPLLAYIGGRPNAFTEKGHNFLPGELVNKQLIIINNSRRTVGCKCSWTLALPQPVTGSSRVSMDTGNQVRIPLQFVLPDTLNPGQYDLSMTVEFSSGETQEDVFSIHVLPQLKPIVVNRRIALFDPKGETGKLMEELGISCDPVNADIDLAPYDMLIVGKQALQVGGAAPDIEHVRDGFKVVMFEQTADVLEKRFGFRVQEYGLRRVFKRVPDHPLLAGLDNCNLRDWQGEATLSPPRIKANLGSRGLMVRRCGITQTRAYRAGCRGNVASVLIEKPARGDFLPILDGGFSLQYSPLIEYREGAGLFLFCQMDVTGRAQRDPAAQLLVRNIIRYVSAYSPGPRRTLVYVGNEAGRYHLESAGMHPGQFSGALDPSQILVVSRGSGNRLASHKETIKAWLEKGGHMLAVGLKAEEANEFMPFIVKMKKAEHICEVFKSKDMDSLLAGIGPADINMREPRELHLISEGATPLDKGVLAVANQRKVVFCQIAPWQFPYEQQYNLKRTFRLTSVLINRLLSNMGADGTAPVLERFTKGSGGNSSPWLNSFYLDKPEEMDDPYRYFAW
jgi:beta-galactosidase